MFKAIYGFFNIIFLLILFKIFAPELFDLAIQILTTLLSFMNEATNQLANTGIPTDFPAGFN
jgi:hypothetical protein